ncbi:hypothetical protein EXU34_19955 [Alteromonas sp. ZYF713]|nr:hypothetical protein [Alteromonas sp. ZYF713]
MATVNIEQRKTKKGIKFRARVRLRNELLEKGYYEESNTFSTRAKAKHWATNRAQYLEVHGMPQSGVKDSDLRDVSLSTLINMYLEQYRHELGRSKYYALKAIANRDIAINLVSAFTVEDIVNYAKERKAEGVTAYTTYQDILYIKSVIAVAHEKEFQVRGDIDFILEAIKKFKDDIRNNVPKHKRLVEFTANERTELPTRKEMELLREALKTREEHQSAKIPYLQILDFAIASCMRVSEICRIKWENFDEDQHTVMVEDRKHPTNKIGNHVPVPLISGAYEIVMERKKQLIGKLKEKGEKFNPQEKIFPYESRSVTAGWQRCRKKLIEEGHSIRQIRFHDLRAYGASLLMDKGWSLSKVSKVTGHRDMNVLNNIYNRLDVTKIALDDFNERHGLNKEKRTEHQ